MLAEQVPAFAPFCLPRRTAVERGTVKVGPPERLELLLSEMERRAQRRGRWERVDIKRMPERFEGLGGGGRAAKVPILRSVRPRRSDQLDAHVFPALLLPVGQAQNPVQANVRADQLPLQQKPKRPLGSGRAVFAILIFDLPVRLGARLESGERAARDVGRDRKAKRHRHDRGVCR